jgi:hypothetical protein
MPRRNRNAEATTISRDALADQAAHMARELTSLARCAGCQVNPATEGDYCALCKGLIIFSARHDTLRRR